MILIMLGAPGAGKGTISKMFVEKDKLVQISTGDILRENINKKTELGFKAQEYMNKGALVPDDLILDIIDDRLRQKDCADGFILDGFPRTIPQAEGLKELLKKLGRNIDAVIDIAVEEQEIIRRLTSRRTCENTKCQAIYNVISKPSKVEGICDLCGSKTIQRSDETEEAIANRLKTYNEKTSPLIDYYRKEGLLKSVNGNDNPENIYKGVKTLVG